MVRLTTKTQGQGLPSVTKLNQEPCYECDQNIVTRLWGRHASISQISSPANKVSAGKTEVGLELSHPSVSLLPSLSPTTCTKTPLPLIVADSPSNVHRKFWRPQNGWIKCVNKLVQDLMQSEFFVSDLVSISNSQHRHVLSWESKGLENWPLIHWCYCFFKDLLQDWTPVNLNNRFSIHKWLKIKQTRGTWPNKKNFCIVFISLFNLPSFI
jgi:hypothetical protein